MPSAIANARPGLAGSLLALFAAGVTASVGCVNVDDRDTVEAGATGDGNGGGAGGSSAKGGTGGSSAKGGSGGSSAKGGTGGSGGSSAKGGTGGSGGSGGSSGSSGGTAVDKCNALLSQYCTSVIDCAVGGGLITSADCDTSVNACLTTAQAALDCSTAVSVTSNYPTCMDALAHPNCDAVIQEIQDGTLQLPSSCMGVILTN